MRVQPKFNFSFTVIVQGFIWSFLALGVCVEALAQGAIAQVDRSVVRVIVKLSDGFGSGTGFVVGLGGVVATNNHVVEGAERSWVLSKQGNGKLQEYPASVLWASPEYDLALLHVEGLEAPALLLAEPLPEKGSQVTSIGYPGIADSILRSDSALGESTFTQGVIGRVVKAGWGGDKAQQNILQHSAAVNGGNSGGPLIDSCGRVVGINTAKAKGQIEGDAEHGMTVNQSDGIFFASHVGILLRILKSQGRIFTSTGDACTLDLMAANHTLVPQSQGGWYVPAGIVAALMLALVTLKVALKKQTVLLESYTQFLRRSGKSPSAVTPPTTKTWMLRGRDSCDRFVALKLHSTLLTTGKLIIGRNTANCQLAIDDPTISRQHASLTLVNGRLQLIDLGSTNGSWIDGVQVRSTPVTLREGQTVAFGKVLLKLEGV